MEKLINELINDYKNDHITWHDIQDIVEGRLVLQAGGMKAYNEIPIKQRIKQENDILTRIEEELKGGK